MSTRTRRARPRLVAVHNTTPDPTMVDLAGHMVPGNTTTRVDPEDPRAAELIAAGVLIVKESA